MWQKLSAYLSSVNLHEFLDKGISGALVLVLAFVAWVFVRSSLGAFEKKLISQMEKTEGVRSSEARKRASTLSKLLRQGCRLLIIVLTLLTFFSEIGVDVGPMLASAGIVGLAVGFGSQKLVHNFIAGFFLVLEDQVRIGDVAVINGQSGTVEAINLRTLVLRDIAGTVHVIANGSINTLSNMTKDWSAYVFEIGIGYKENISKAIQVIEEVGVELRKDKNFASSISNDLEIFGVNSWGDSSIVIKARIKTLPSKQWSVGREFWKRLKIAFDAHDIEIPFPYRSIDFGKESLSVVIAHSESPHTSS